PTVFQSIHGERRIGRGHEIGTYRVLPAAVRLGESVGGGESEAPLAAVGGGGRDLVMATGDPPRAEIELERSSGASVVVRPLISDCLGGAAQQRRRPHAGSEQDRAPGGPQRAAGGRTAAGGPVAAGGRAGCGRDGCAGEPGEGDRRSCSCGGKG